MNERWTRGLNEEDAETIKHLFANSGLIRERLSAILEEMRKEINRQAESAKDYDNPNWALKQADYIGAKRTISRILTIIS